MKVVVTELIWDEGLEILSQCGEVSYDANLWRSGQLEEVVADADALIVRNQTRVTGNLLDSAPKLKVIGRLGVGLDNIDLAAASDRHITVVYARNANAVSVAEYVFATVLTFARRLQPATEDVKQGNWNRRSFTGTEIYAKTLGLIGIGEIGSRVAVRAKAFGMGLLGYDPFLPPYELAVADFGVTLTTLEDVLSRSDFISIHVPLTQTTRHLINRHTLSLVKQTSCIINTSRGGIVEEADLSEALAAGKLAGAALDVFENEPPLGSPFFNLDNVILTPHIAGLTEEAQVKTSVLVAEEVAKVLAGGASNCAVR